MLQLTVLLLIGRFPVLAQDGGDTPNVILILADDHCYRDFGFMGNDNVATPNIDRLAARSARYPNGYVPMSVCRPSLATILTGLYPHQHGIHFNHPPPGLAAMRKMNASQYEQTRATADHLIERVPTLPRILTKHGYACLQTGKHWEGSYKTAGFTHGMTLAKPADRLGPVTGTRTQTNGEWVAHGNGDAGLVIGRETMKPIYDFVNEFKGKQPCFVWYAPFLPHTPFDAPQRFHDVYGERKGIEKHVLPYYAEIARFDETVGGLLKYLEDAGELSNTIIILASDNGFRPHESKAEAYNSRSKLSQFEDGLRTPILICWDGHTIPATHASLVQTVDLLPTILSAVGLSNEITAEMRGSSLMPSATGQSALPNRSAFGAIYPNDAAQLGSAATHVRGRWVRDGDFKLIVPGTAKKPLEAALYDLRNDPDETTNLIDDERHRPQIKRLRRLVDDWWQPTLHSISP